MVIPLFSITSDQCFVRLYIKNNEISGFHAIPIHIFFIKTTPSCSEPMLSNNQKIEKT